MRFTVVWSPQAQEELTELWLSATNRRAVQRATDAIDRRLKVDAHLEGRAFFEQRILAVMSVAVTYSVSVDDRLVRVLQVWSRTPQ